jgi:hypothetical protein
MSLSISTALFESAFEYQFEIGEVDAQFFGRVTRSIQKRGGIVITTNSNALVFQISIAKLSKYSALRLFTPELLLKDLVTLQVNENRLCRVRVKNVTKKNLVRIFLTLAALSLSIALAQQGKVFEILTLLPIFIFIYILASQIPSMGQYPRVRNFLLTQKE